MGAVGLEISFYTTIPGTAVESLPIMATFCAIMDLVLTEKLWQLAFIVVRVTVSCSRNNLAEPIFLSNRF
jgi:hypothetical protein